MEEGRRERETEGERDGGRERWLDLASFTRLRTNFYSPPSWDLPKSELNIIYMYLYIYIYTQYIWIHVICSLACWTYMFSFVKASLSYSRLSHPFTEADIHTVYVYVCVCAWACDGLCVLVLLSLALSVCMLGSVLSGFQGKQQTRKESVSEQEKR